MGRRQAEEDGDAAGEGHNSILNEAQFFELDRSITSAERKKDTAVAELRVARKQAKEAGLDLKAYDRVRKLQGFTRPELAEQFETERQYAAHLRVPVYAEGVVEEAKPESEETLAADAEERGYVAGKRGETRKSNPWDLTTPLGQRWDAGHERGQRENLPKKK